MSGTFPFVVAYQIVAGSAFAFVVGLSITAALLSFGLISIMSLAGFYEGWRTGWQCGKGQKITDVLWRNRSTKLLLSLLNKLGFQSKFKA